MKSLIDYNEKRLYYKNHGTNQKEEDENQKRKDHSFKNEGNEIHIETLKRKTNRIIQYQKPYISKFISGLL